MLKIKSITKESITLFITPIAYANAIRRILISELPSLAIEQIEISENTSVLPDEIIAHRLAMLPIYSEKADSLFKVDQCLCKTLCEKCSISFTLNVNANMGEKNKDDDIRFDVYSNSIKTNNSNNLFPINSLLHSLEKNQSLKIKGNIIRGIGMDHSKFTNVIVSYKYDINNKNRETEFWKEHDTTINNEWHIKQDEPNLIERDELVEMNIEVNDGVFEPEFTIKQSIYILQSKMEKIFNSLKEAFNF